MAAQKNDSKKSGVILYDSHEAERSDGDQHAAQRRIAERAHQKFEARGGEHGHDHEDWASAEAELASEARAPRVESFDETARMPATQDGVHARSR